MRFYRDDMTDALLYATVKIVPTDLLPPHPTRKRKVYYQAHPHLVWLFYKIRRFIRIMPWTTGYVPDFGDAVYMRQGNTLFMPTRTYYLMKWSKKLW